jgi:hypothetical protein
MCTTSTSVHTRHFVSYICSPAAPQYVNFQYSRYEPFDVIITCGPHHRPRSFFDKYCISILLREELHRTSSRDLSKQCPFCFENLAIFSSWRAWGHGLPGSRDPCRKLAYSAKAEIRGHLAYDQTCGSVSFGLGTSAPAAGVQRAHGAPQPQGTWPMHEPSR